MRIEIVDNLKTVFYNGDEIWNQNLSKCTIQERNTWQQIIVLDNVQEIPPFTFYNCLLLEKVILNQVKYIHHDAIGHCPLLTEVIWSEELEYIGSRALQHSSLKHVYLPKKCKKVDNYAFANCTQLEIFHMDHTGVMLGTGVVEHTKLSRYLPSTYHCVYACMHNAMLRNLHGNNEKYALHALCKSRNLELNQVYEIIQNEGLNMFHDKDHVDVTPSQYLASNPYVDLKEIDIIKYYILRKMGEIIIE